MVARANTIIYQQLFAKKEELSDKTGSALMGDEKIMNIEDVKKGLKLCVQTGDFCGECPYDGTELCIDHLHDDALELLKKRVQKETPTTMERINVIKVDGNDFYKGFCPACQTIQYGIKSKYCDQCGQAVKWDDD